MSSRAAPPKVLTDFFRSGKRLEYKKGEFLIRPGETPPGVFFIESGLVKSYAISKYGEENLLVIRHAGELLGITWAMTGEDRHIMYAALTPTQVWLVSHEQFIDFLDNRPEATLPLLQMVTDMYRVNSERILTLAYRTVRERLVAFLLSTAKRFGAPVHNGILLDVPLRHQDIASSISATRETTGRELTALERKGLLSNQSLFITLHDVEALRKLL